MEHTITLLTDHIMFADVRKITKKHYYKWKSQWNDLYYDDLESETMEWLTLHREQCVQVFSEKGYWHYLGWMNKSIGRMLSRYCQEHTVRSRSFIALGSLDTATEGTETMQTLPVGLTYYITLQGIKNGREDLLSLAALHCTDKQYYAIKRLLFDGEKPAIVAKEMGVAYGTPRFHMDRGIHNIVSKAQ